MSTWSITFSGSSDNPQVGYTMSADGPGIYVGTVLRGVLACCAGQLSEQALRRLTLVCPEPINLPKGWAATADGVSVSLAMESGTQSYSRTYVYGEDGEPVVAPCAADGSPLLATALALLPLTPQTESVSEPPM